MTRPVSPEKKSEYQANRRKKYAEDAEHRARVTKRNLEYLKKNREEIEARRKKKRREDHDWRIAENARRVQKRLEQKAVDPDYDEKARRYFRQWRYGLSPDQFDKMLIEQGGVCAICAKAADLYVDHCHTSGKVRGLLCRTCNAGIGQFYEDIAVMHSAINYIKDRC